jgi:hypothetical protein
MHFKNIILGCVAILFFGSCGKSSTTTTSAGSASGSAGSDKKNAQQVQPPPATTASRFSDAELCATPGLLMVNQTIDAATSDYCKRCAHDDAKACAAWPAVGNCKQADDLRNTIYASFGHPFKKKFWQERFGTLAWYKPNVAAKEAEMSEIAVANIKALKAQGCSAAEFVQSDIERALQTQINASAVSAPATDFDGDGNVDSVSYDVATTTVRIGKGSYKFGDSIHEETVEGIIVLDINVNDKQRELLVSSCLVDGEDACTWSFLKYQKGKISLLGSLGRGATVAGNGAVVDVTDDCGEVTTNTYELKADELKQISSKKSGTKDMKDCSACPYVFAGDGSSLVFQGKIARNLVGIEHEALQSLGVVGPKSGQFVRVRISERESEVTQLDQVFLTVDGNRVNPDQCVAHTKLALCEADGRRHRLDYGDDIELTFDVGAIAATAKLELWAIGFYDPIATMTR